MPPAGMVGHVCALLRAVALVSLTTVLLTVFLTGRALRHRLGGRVTFHFAVARFWSWATLRLLGLTLEIRGRPISAGVLVANHSSWLDIPALRAVRLIYFVAKSEVRNWPVIGFITAVCGTIYIERRRSQARRQERLLRERAGNGDLLCVFPEGTSTDGLRVLPFKSSLFSAFFGASNGAELLVQPVTIRHAPTRDAGLPPSFYGWWGEMALGPHLWAVMGRSFGGRTTVIFHDPVRPGDFPDRKALARHCEQVVREGLRTLLARERDRQRQKVPTDGST